MHAFDFETLCSRAGQGTGDGEPLVAPIVQSTTFCREGVDSRAEHQYSRVSNPTVAALERELGRLEDAPPAACFTSGLAAESALFLALLETGDHVVLGRSIYGGTTRLAGRILAGLGIESTVVDSTRVDAVRDALRPGTKLVFLETPANPTLELTNVAAIAAVAREITGSGAAGAKVAVDNTFQTAVLQQPLELGADISVYSTTKFIEGHSVAPGGAVVSRDEDVLERVRFLRKCTGAIQTPLHAWLTLQGLKTLPLRLRRQSQTAAELAEWVAGRIGVSEVYYPTLRGAEGLELAKAQHLGAHGAVLSFELEGGLGAARSFANAAGCRLVEHVGSVETLLTHPASMTHADVPPSQQAAVGIAPGLLRLSVGLESVGAIRAYLEPAFRAAASYRDGAANEGGAETEVPAWTR